MLTQNFIFLEYNICLEHSYFVMKQIRLYYKGQQNSWPIRPSNILYFFKIKSEKRKVKDIFISEITFIFYSCFIIL